jgi:hypothetical protein
MRRSILHPVIPFTSHLHPLDTPHTCGILKAVETAAGLAEHCVPHRILGRPNHAGSSADLTTHFLALNTHVSCWNTIPACQPDRGLSACYIHPTSRCFLLIPRPVDAALRLLSGGAGAARGQCCRCSHLQQRRGYLRLPCICAKVQSLPLNR